MIQYTVLFILVALLSNCNSVNTNTSKQSDSSSEQSSLLSSSSQALSSLTSAPPEFPLSSSASSSSQDPQSQSSVRENQSSSIEFPQSSSSTSIHSSDDSSSKSYASSNHISSSQDHSDPTIKGWKLKWNDEFNGTGSVDPSKWTHETQEPGANNSELQKYTTREKNSYQDNGFLNIVGREDWWQSYQYTSARLKSHGHFEFTYGRVDVRAQIPSGSGSWPAIWMLGTNIFSGAGWPGCGEIDIMEYVGTHPGVIHGTVHAPNYSGATAQQGTIEESTVENDFHIYSVQWYADRIEFYFDHEHYFTALPQGGDQYNASAWPYTGPQFILLNLAIGGWGGDPDASAFPMRFLVDYVRVYKKK
ncbi:MAG: glycoside hydrolase family 16 protein [Fibrobacterales bacterium]